MAAEGEDGISLSSESHISLSANFTTPCPEGLHQPTEPTDTAIDSKRKNLEREELEENQGGEVTADPNPEAKPLWKTSLCSYFRRHSQSCRHAESCRYAHGEEELKPRPDNSWDPTSERAKKLLKTIDAIRNDGVGDFPREDVLPSTGSDGEGDGASSSLRKCIVNLPKQWNSDKLKTFLTDQGIIYATAKKRKGMAVGFVDFANPEHVTHAIEVLDGKVMGNRQVKVVDVKARAFERTSGLAISSNNPGGIMETDFACGDAGEKGHSVEIGKSGANNLASKTRTVREVVTPLAHMQYDDQLDYKKNSLLQTLKRLTRNARKACPDGVPLPEWVIKSRDIGGLPCNLEGIIKSPLINGYRNKCEFSIGYSQHGEPTVGFMLGNFREGMTAVEDPGDCPNISSIACRYASIFQSFIRTSVLPVWNRIQNTGFWRQLTVREGRAPSQPTELERATTSIAEVMLIVQVCPLGVDEELKSSEFQRMAQSLAEGAYACSPPLPFTSLVVQEHKGISNAAPVDSPLLPLRILQQEGTSEHNDNLSATEPRIRDYISNLRFSISPTAFFQVNTLAAEKLYNLAGEWAGLGPDTLLFDICCGTGTIGLTLAQHVGMVVGVEMNASAVCDALRNAETNGIKNCRFVCAKAEDVMSALLKEYLDFSQQEDDSLLQLATNGSEKINDENSLSNEIGTPESAYNSLEKTSDKDNVTNGMNTGSASLTSHIDHVEMRLNTSDTFGSNVDSSKVVNIDGSVNVGLNDLNPENSIIEDKNKQNVKLQFKNVVAIVDPPRVGLHPVVIKAIRTHPGLRRLVYISCNLESCLSM
ncbi:zinc finger CCCH domain-containing protein 24 isoform X2 [Amborella trichopoda]|uniref:zinc finger CCCH domain-containing protein 24 isoform X2 n=1 Tax=Amborella trichopoda TaxID=13333 RepID=UPI0009C0B482|nr:zinc finger CCCH domain-containing protein 24 isoform X2 [Amborella trichopoda]|eukprot:XP_020529292.1 zinc finger CCCH domain-containing protein 24 isoform X2 [Amborella trichopoda]